MCQNVFSYKSSLKGQLRTYTSESSVEVFTCKLCLKKSENEIGLRMHIGSHACERCLKSISYDACDDKILKVQKSVENDLKEKDGNQNIIFQVF